MKEENWTPKKGDKFNAIQRKTDAPTGHNPQTCIEGGKWYITAEDAVGNQRKFHHEEWRFEKVEKTLKENPNQ